MNSCITDQGEGVCDEKEISIEVDIFSQTFIEKTNKKTNKQKTDDSEIPSLSDEEINNIEGKITLKEVTRAFGVRSLNDSFEKSEL